LTTDASLASTGSWQLGNLPLKSEKEKDNKVLRAKQREVDHNINDVDA